ncbi:MAG: hypothetical protein AAFY21_05640 [Cyanobacteria bacterium J06641_2]
MATKYQRVLPLRLTEREYLLMQNYSKADGMSLCEFIRCGARVLLTEYIESSEQNISLTEN